MQRLMTGLIALLLMTLPTFAADVAGVVKNSKGDVVTKARVTLVELQRSMFVDDSGRFSFSNLPEGDYHVFATAPGFGNGVVEVTVPPNADISITLDDVPHRERISVTGNRIGQGTNEITQAVTVIERAEILEDLEPTIGDLVAREVGVSSTSFGPGASRPVIRGQQGARVRVLESGIGVGDASTTSVDHAIAVDPLEAERIEILRGPSVLLYGSTATGGIVNVIDRRIPTEVPKDKVSGEVAVRYGTAAEEGLANIRLTGGVGNGFAWQASGLARDSSDLSVPARGDASDPTLPDDTLPNSAVESAGGSFGVMWRGNDTFFGLSYKRFDTEYGIPAALEEEEDEESAFLLGIPADERISIDLEQVRYDLRGGYDASGDGVFKGVRFRGGFTDYEHVELEGGSPGTVFQNENLEGRFEVIHGKGKWSGISGAQAINREFEAIGDEAFVPPSETQNVALFSLNTFEIGEGFEVEAGLRFESQETTADGEVDADFDGLSASAGIRFEPSESFLAGFTVSRSTRMPTAEELYSNGPHLATFSFEVGDPTLSEETATGFELLLRKRTGRVTGQVVLFATEYDDFIFEAPTGDIDDGLPVFMFQQDEAVFTGYEVSGSIHLLEDADNELDLLLQTDRVDARSLGAGSGDLPFIPPRSHRVELQYRRAGWGATVGARIVEEQERIADFETPTDGYTLLDASVRYTLTAGRLVHQFMLVGRNLGDEEARVHASRLRNVVLLPGADVSLTYRLVF